VTARWKEQPVQQFITNYGYLAVFLLMLAESACIPVPSEVIMLFGGALAGGAVAGVHPSLAGIVLAGVLGNVAGSYLAWAVGWHAGLPAVRRWGGKVGIRDHEIDRATRWFDKYGPAAVLVGRVVPVVRTFISLPAGFAKMPALPFGLYTTIGCIPWTAALGIAGYALGANWQQVANDFHGPTYVIAGLIAVGLVAAVILHFRHRRRARGGAEAASSASAALGRQAPDWQSADWQAADWQSADWQAPDWQAPDWQAADQQASGPQPHGPQPPIAFAPGAEPSARQWVPSDDRPYR
jgi:membrane protein DedA with SNARE-associated domain